MEYDLSRLNPDSLGRMNILYKISRIWRNWVYWANFWKQVRSQVVKTGHPHLLRDWEMTLIRKPP